jgi:hypothetical protein
MLTVSGASSLSVDSFFEMLLRKLLELLLNLFNFLVDCHDFLFVKKMERLHEKFVLFLNFRNGIIQCYVRFWFS